MWGLSVLSSESRGRGRDDEGEPARVRENRACTLLRKCYGWQVWRAGSHAAETVWVARPLSGGRPKMEDR